MSFAKKLMIAFAVMMVATMAVGIAAWTGLSGLSAEFERAADKDAKKLELAGNIQTALSEMNSFEKGQEARTFADDMAKVQVYENSFSESRKLVGSLIGECRLLVHVERGKHDLDLLEKGLSSWAPLHGEFEQALAAKQTKKALDIHAAASIRSQKRC
ncbi:MAG: MCP four helix bundle domain-containing protein [Bryobacteraceae bacterium]|jgi:hypothetical protein